MVTGASHWRQSSIAALPMVLTTLLMLLASQFPVPYLNVALPLLPALAAAYYWSLFRPESLPLIALAPLSLLHDVLYGLGMGSSLMLFLLLYFVGNWMRGRMILEQFLLVWALFAPAMFSAWALLCLVQQWVQATSLRQLMQAYDMVFIVTWCSYPVFHLLFNWCYHQLPKQLKP